MQRDTHASQNKTLGDDDIPPRAQKIKSKQVMSKNQKTLNGRSFSLKELTTPHHGIFSTLPGSGPQSELCQSDTGS